MVSNGEKKLDELFRQIWSLEQGFTKEPSVELAQTLVACLSRIGNRGYYNPVLGISWMPLGMEQKRKTYQSYLDSNSNTTASSI